MNLQQTIASLSEADSSAIATVTWDGIQIGLGLRQQFEQTLNTARVRGAEVTVFKTRGLLATSYAIRLRGTARQLLPMLRLMGAVLPD